MRSFEIPNGEGLVVLRGRKHKILDKIYAVLDLYVPKLSYTYEVLRLERAAGVLYPTRAFETYEGAPKDGGPRLLENDADFERFLLEIFSSEPVQKIVKDLVAQAQLGAWANTS